MPNAIQLEINKEKAYAHPYFPIGSIYMSVNNINPSTYFGGTWVRWGNGRVPVGVDTSQTEFNTVQKTGGAKTHTLTVAQMPSHVHTYATTQTSGNPQVSFPQWTMMATYGGQLGSQASRLGANTLNTGSGQAHNNLQPYITCYMWLRTA
ncbi:MULTISPECIES: hypothetical protein [unclassified Breznakia]|uniref:phage baseplate protein n=1 Tax=unclassified Breznakia TaxID=2623764 RepID=UPI002473F6F3|nr:MULTISPECIES: hypothetical protein [unclassified Breznakia]MDH6367566.1 microcystin-dependent protein [Breznakia sp. PH1-1]MDH6404640.1 microcystin-dependent protein [Breznakia sp. PF1-11]MDH6412396.1 microcystin-dependent protein [Breznakia sp. PFB1-11]MDH6414734.1 microcystin-dependent protein [Breznakia sp. PFB1-14]MDH6417021.1 microcystin-dependent protein [Breznakia sp. PFB1-4]